jgi:hypothetical protein
MRSLKQKSKVNDTTPSIPPGYRNISAIDELDHLILANAFQKACIVLEPEFFAR